MTAFIVLIAIFGVIIVITVGRSQADNTTQSATVLNSAPVIDTIMIATTDNGADISSLSLTENSTKTVYIYGQMTDENGCDQINNSNNLTIRFYRSDIAGEELCVHDKNNCYPAPNRQDVDDCLGASDLQASYHSSFLIDHFTDPTDSGSPNAPAHWIAMVKVRDGESTSVPMTDTVEIESLLAFDVTNSINFGTVELGNDSAVRTIEFTNVGNRAADASQSGSGDMICSGNGSNDIPTGNVHLSAESGFAYGTNDQSLSTSSTNFDLSLQQRTSEYNPLTKNVSLILRMPSSGVSGICANTITFTATADA